MQYMRICVITCCCEVVVGPGAQLCTLFRGVGSGSRDVDAWRANGPHAEGRGLQVPIGLEHGGVSLGRMTY